MTPCKIKEAAKVKRRQAAILKAVGEESLTMAQIEAKFPRLPAGVIRGSVGFMIRLGLLASAPTGGRTKNGNTINAYSVSGKDTREWKAGEPEPFMLGEVWRGFPRVMPVTGVTRHNRMDR